jgi:hypothetical protein
LLGRNPSLPSYRRLGESPLVLPRPHQLY